MDKQQEFGISDYREMNKMELDTFTFDKDNILDYPVDILISSLITKIDKLRTEQDNLNNSEETINHSLGQQLLESNLEIYYFENELYALYEIKIIYAYKHLEINIKKLLSAAYHDRSVNKKFNWESFTQFLKLKKIEYKKLDGYSAVNELRLVSNTIKHSVDLSDPTLKNIAEFNSQTDSFKYFQLKNFYDRIKLFPITFLDSLAGQIYNDLYDFTDEKIGKMAESIALRMEEVDALNLSTKITNYYK